MSFTGDDPLNDLKGAGKCPLCGAVAKAVEHAEYRWVCNVCGGPRIEVKREGVKLSGEEAPYLQQANKAKNARAAWRFAGFLGGAAGAMGLLSTLLLLWLFSSTLLTVLGVGLSVPFLLVALAAFAKDQARTNEIDKQIDNAWRIAGRDVVMQSKGMTSEQLTEILPMKQADADQLASELAVDNMLHSRVNADGKLQLTPVGQTQVRIDAADAAGPTIVADDPLEQRFAALEEAMAAEQEAEQKRTMKQ